MPRPRGQVRIRQARHGAWVVEVHYRGAALPNFVGMKLHQGEALALAEFTRLLHADDQLFLLDTEGDRICTEHFRAGWMSESTEPAEDEQ